MISPGFMLRFSPVLEAFGSNRFPAIVLERIEKRTSDLAPPEFDLLCSFILDNCDRAPTTMKVVEYANLVRARRARGEERFVERINCFSCDDLGIIRVRGLHDDTDELMRCACKEGTDQTWKLPQWVNECGSMFRSEKCPIPWFKVVDPISKKTDLRTHPAVHEWRARIKKSEKYFL